MYLQPITMAVEGKHEMHHLAADKSDIHLEADIHAVEENPNGFAEGDWIPYLKVDYKVTKLDDPKKPSPAPLWRWLPATARTTVKT